MRLKDPSASDADRIAFRDWIEAEPARRALQRIAEARAERMRHGDMRHAARPEEALGALHGTVDELVHDHEMPGRQVAVQDLAPQLVGDGGGNGAVGAMIPALR